MADQPRDGHRDEDEPKIVIRDRRRVNLEGDFREVEGGEAASPPPCEPVAEVGGAPEPPAAEATEPTEEERIQQIRERRKARRAGQEPRRGGALGGADEARVQRGPQLQEVDQPEAEGDEAAAAQINNVYEYVQVLSSELMMWSLASLGFMPQPGSGIVTTDQDQAQFALAAAESLLETLLEQDESHLDRVRALIQSFVIQFGSIAAELLQQPPQSRLQDMSKIRFCIDAADRFAEKFEGLSAAETGAEADTQIAQIKQFVAQLRLAYVQASGGGGIIG